MQPFARLDGRDGGPLRIHRPGRRARWTALALAAAGLLGGCDAVCDGNFDLALHAQTPVAVGATAGATVVDVTPSAGKGDTCTDERVWASTASVDDPAVFGVAPLDGSFVVRLTALSAGSTTLRVEGESAYASESLSLPVRARVADQVTLALPAECTAPLRYGAAHEFALDFELRAAGEHLWGWGLWPFASPVATVVNSRSSAEQVAFLTSAAAASGVITSPVDAALQLPVEVFGAGDVEALELTTKPFFTLRPRGDLYVWAGGLAGGSALCDDSFARQAAVATPSTCLLNRYYDFGTENVFYGPGPFLLRGVAAGACTVTVSLVDQPQVSVTRTYTVGP